MVIGGISACCDDAVCGGELASCAWGKVLANCRKRFNIVSHACQGGVASVAMVPFLSEMASPME